MSETIQKAVAQKQETYETEIAQIQQWEPLALLAEEAKEVFPVEGATCRRVGTGKFEEVMQLECSE